MPDQIAIFLSGHRIRGRSKRYKVVSLVELSTRLAAANLRRAAVGAGPTIVVNFTLSLACDRHQPAANDRCPLDRRFSSTNRGLKVRLTSRLAGTEIQHVYVGTEANVVRQVPAVMIRIFVNHDIV